MRIQIWCLLESFAAHLTGQCGLIFNPLGGGRSWSRIVQRTLVFVVPAGTRGRCRVRAERLLAVRKHISHFVGNEAVARQRGGGCETGAALQALLISSLRPSSPVLADVLQEQCLVLCGETTGGTAEPWIRMGVGAWGRQGLRLVCWSLPISRLFILLHLHSSSLSATCPHTGVLFWGTVGFISASLWPQETNTTVVYLPVQTAWIAENDPWIVTSTSDQFLGLCNRTIYNCVTRENGLSIHIFLYRSYRHSCKAAAVTWHTATFNVIQLPPYVCYT